MIIDAFSGAGGWECGLAAMRGGDCLGVEYDPDMVATARAAGHRAELADVSAIDPRELLGGKRCEGLIASPPCPSFSAGGKQLGRQDLPVIHQLITELAGGIDRRSEYRMHDERSRLTCEPMRWATLLQPEWIALEQVPAVLPVWQDMARLLESHYGYSTWAGVVYAECYGVPQTRQRAVLLASRAREVAGPVATHRRWYPPAHKYAVSGNGDGHLPRWISMGEALGWDENTIINTRGDRKTSGGNDFRADRPSWGLTEKVRSWWTYRPATTLSGDPRISGPGHKDGRPGSGYPRQQDNAIRVTIEEAAVLQTFRPDYPFQGTRSKQFLQAGNSIPVLLAEALLRAVI